MKKKTSISQVFSGDLLIFVFDWWDLASKQNYEKKTSKFDYPSEVSVSYFSWLPIWFDYFPYYFPLDLVKFHPIRLNFV